MNFLPMNPRRRTSPLRWLGALLALAAVGALWVEFAPSRAGGSADYAVIDGISMNPKLHAGDLVLLHPASSYQVGDVVGYHNLQLGRLVLHRIVGRVGDRYVFKGDNNNFLDAYHPTQAQLVGKLWIQMPKVGGFFTWLHEPNHSALAVAVVALLVLLGGGAGAVRRRRRHGGRRTTARTQHRRQRPQATPAAPNPAAARTLLSAAATVAAVAGLVTLIAFTHGKTTTTSAPGAYAQSGAFAYSGRTAPSPVYPSGRITTGQTVFTRLVDEVSPSFDYRFVSALPHTVTGTARLQETLQSSTGWSKALPSPAPVTIANDHALVVGRLDLVALEAQLKQYFRLTGIPNDSFTVTVAPTVDISGIVGTAPVTSTFAPTPLTFALDEHSLRLQQTATPTSPGEPAPPDAMHPSEPGILPQTEPASVKLVVVRTSDTRARTIGLAGLALALLLALVGALLLGRGGSDELATIRRRGGDLLVPVSSPPVRPAGGYVDVANFDSLAHLARSYELVILHHERGDEHSFYIDDDGSIYRYRVRAGEEVVA